MLGKCSDHAGGFKHLPKACLSSQCQLEDPPEGSRDPRYNRRGWYGCSFWRVPGSRKRCTPCWNGHCPETPATGDELLCSTSLQNYPEPQGRWVEMSEMRLCSPSLTRANQRELLIAVPAMKGQNKRGLYSGFKQTRQVSSQSGRPPSTTYRITCLLMRNINT